MMEKSIINHGLSLTVDVAINSQLGTAVKLEESARRLGLSLSYCEQIARHLIAGKILKSKRGRGGGYLLAKPAERLTVFSVCRQLRNKSGKLNVNKYTKGLLSGLQNARLETEQKLTVMDMVVEANAK